MSTPTLTPRDNGVFRLPAEIGSLRDAAAGLRWHVAEVGGAADGAAVCAALAAELEFPADFGGNWDALNDALQDLSWFKTGGCVLQLKGVAALTPATRGTLLEILADAAAFWRRRGQVFVALVDGGRLPALPPR